MKKILSLMLLLTLAKAGHTAFELERPGARAVGMAGAFTALADDNDALLYNPAGLAGLQEACLSTGWAKLYAGLDDGQLTESQLAFTYPLTIPAALGLLWHQRNLFGLYQESRISLGYGQALDQNKSWEVGAVVNLLMLQYTDDQALAQDDFLRTHSSLLTAAVDAGVLYTPLPHWTIGLSAANVNRPNVALFDEPVLLPMQLRAGLAYQNDTLDGSLDWWQFGNTYRLSLGGEYWWFHRLLATRAGMALDNDGLQELTAGLGFNIMQSQWALQLDYGFVLPMGEQLNLGSSHYLGLAWHFGRNRLTPLEQEGMRLKIIGQAALDKGDNQRALDAWEEAVEYLPDDEQLAEALLSLQDEVDKHSKFEIYKTQAENYETKQDWTNAAKAYRKALDIIPEDDEVNRAWNRVKKEQQTMDKEERKKKKARARKVNREIKATAVTNLTEANRLVTQSQRRDDIQRYFKEAWRKLSDDLQAAKAAYRQRDYEAANDQSVSIINDIKRLGERAAIKAKAMARKMENRPTLSTKPISEKIPPQAAPAVKPAQQRQHVLKKVDEQKKERRRARGAYGRAVKLMIEIDQKKGDTYFPERYQKMKNHLVVVKTKLQQGDYVNTIAMAEALFPNLEKLKKECEQKEAARKALPTGW